MPTIKSKSTLKNPVQLIQHPIHLNKLYHNREFNNIPLTPPNNLIIKFAKHD